jgi:hypothetical protein
LHGSHHLGFPLDTDILSCFIEDHPSNKFQPGFAVKWHKCETKKSGYVMAVALVRKLRIDKE